MLSSFLRFRRHLAAAGFRIFVPKVWDTERRNESGLRRITILSRFHPPPSPNKLSSLRNESLGYRRDGETIRIKIESHHRLPPSPPSPRRSKFSSLRAESLGHREAKETERIKIESHHHLPPSLPSPCCSKFSSLRAGSLIFRRGGVTAPIQPPPPEHKKYGESQSGNSP